MVDGLHGGGVGPVVGVGGVALESGGERLGRLVGALLLGHDRCPLWSVGAVDGGGDSGALGGGCAVGGSGGVRANEGEAEVREAGVGPAVAHGLIAPVSGGAAVAVPVGPAFDGAAPVGPALLGEPVG